MIPLHNGTTSVGVVQNQEISNRKKATHPSGTVPSAKEHYLDQLKLAPAVYALVCKGEMNSEYAGANVRTASDYSYSASSYAGPHYRVVGDAGGKLFALGNQLFLLTLDPQLSLTHTSLLEFTWPSLAAYRLL